MFYETLYTGLHEAINDDFFISPLPISPLLIDWMNRPYFHIYKYSKIFPEFSYEEYPIYIISPFRLKISAAGSGSYYFRSSIGNFPGLSAETIYDRLHRDVYFDPSLPAQDEAILEDENEIVDIDILDEVA